MFKLPEGALSEPANHNPKHTFPVNQCFSWKLPHSLVPRHWYLLPSTVSSLVKTLCTTLSDLSFSCFRKALLGKRLYTRDSLNAQAFVFKVCLNHLSWIQGFFQTINTYFQLLSRNYQWCGEMTHFLNYLFPFTLILLRRYFLPLAPCPKEWHDIFQAAKKADRGLWSNGTAWVPSEEGWEVLFGSGMSDGWWQGLYEIP